jgi:hypothetical protein
MEEQGILMMKLLRGYPQAGLGLLACSTAETLEYTPLPARLDTPLTADLPFQDLPSWDCFPMVQDQVWL